MTIEKFAEKWQQQHYPTMDLQAEVPFYYDIYQRICSVAKERCKEFNEFYVIQILRYVENMAHLKLDGVYAQLYRQSEDMVGHWCGLMELSAPTVNAVKMIVGEAIGSAVGLLFPNSYYRQEVYLQLFNEDSRIASNMVSSDFAFNWKDKEGVTVMQRLSHCFQRMGDAVTAHSLSTIRGIRLNCYRVVASKDGKLTLMKRDNEQW